jgi:hypothetical protein
LIDQDRIVESPRQLHKRLDGGDVEQRDLWMLVFMREVADKATNKARRRLPIGAPSDPQNRPGVSRLD